MNTKKLEQQLEELLGIKFNVEFKESRGVKELNIRFENTGIY